MSDLIHLSERDVERLAPPPGALADALELAFRLRHADRISMPAKSGLSLEESDVWFHAMPAAVPGLGAGVKWVGGSPSNARRHLPGVHALMVLSDLETGRPTAVIEAGHLTGIRTAAVTLLAARYLARGDARTLALIGCGFQARTHFEALRSEFPLAHVLLHSRRCETMDAFAESVGAVGLTPHVIEDPSQALSEAEIVVSTIPAQPGLAPFLDATLLPPGAMASMVDRGRSWRPDRLGAFDRIYTDDLVQSRALAESDPGLGATEFVADLGALAAGAAPGRESEGERLDFVFPGAAFADVVTANLLVRRAAEE